MGRFIKSVMLLGALAVGGLMVSPTSADACAGLIGSNGAVNLGSTTTLAAYHEGLEHYVTAFEFQGGGGQFGTLIPLPGVPSQVERGGGWTLQRLVKETTPQRAASAKETLALAASGAEVLQEVRIDALDITILKGGSADVAAWAQEHGFRLSPDAPEVLEFYAQRSPIFMAAVFDGEAAKARGQQIGDGTPVHLTIPTENPWVPLRILGLGKKADDAVNADVFLLTDRLPSLLPGERSGLDVTHSAKATKTLLDDLRADDGMAWVPASAWLTRIDLDTTAGELQYDLAVDASGRGEPSKVAAGLASPLSTTSDDRRDEIGWAVIGIAAVATAAAVVTGRRLGRI
ncbi:MAG: DUF2330 domain-containing protein [Dehalococcoidia bacterium]